MGLFKLFGNKEKNTVISKGFYELRISEIKRLSKSAVKVSFEVPEYTANVDAIGTLRILDSIKTLGIGHKVKYKHFFKSSERNCKHNFK